MYKRLQAGILEARLAEPRRFIQIVTGPRQVGKTTLTRQAIEATPIPCRYASADDAGSAPHTWIAAQWELARRLAAEAGEGGAALALDEVQKVPLWSSEVKRLWDEDTAADCRLKVILLGSSPLLLQVGLTESLAGRFELIPTPHWSYAEMREAFAWDLETYILHGGYPGAVGSIGEWGRWARYVRDALVETSISRDILMLTRVDKPALLRQLFFVGCAYSGQIVSYTKLLGELHDAGNSTTVAHYLELLQGAGMLTGLSKYSAAPDGGRRSTPKMQVMDNAFRTAFLDIDGATARKDSPLWGRLVESAVGAHLVNATFLDPLLRVGYWRELGDEVDFTLARGRRLLAIEVKSGTQVRRLRGLERFRKRFPHARSLLVGADGVPIEEFLLAPPAHWLD